MNQMQTRTRTTMIMQAAAMKRGVLPFWVGESVNVVGAVIVGTAGEGRGLLRKAEANSSQEMYRLVGSRSMACMMAALTIDGRNVFSELATATDTPVILFEGAGGTCPVNMV